jgi:DNA-binding beta-propeller fold protein YncE
MRRAPRWSVLAGCLALGLGCGEGATPASPGATSSSILLDAKAGRLYVTSPDDDAVVEVDPDDLSVLRRFEVPGGPEQLAPFAGQLAVSLGRGAAVAWVELASGTVTRSEVPCGGTAGLAADDAAVFVACPMDDRVVEVTPAGVLRAWRVPGGPAALAAVGDELVVALARTGDVVRFERAALRRAPVDLGRPPATEPAVRHPLEPRVGFAATDARAFAVEPASGGLALAYQVVDHDSDRSRPPEQGGYGSVVDARPRIEPRLWAACGGRYARFEGGLRVMSGPSALAAAGGWLWVAHRQTDNVAALRCEALEGPDARPSDAELGLQASFTVGRGPRGVAVAPDGRTAWVDVGFDHAVARLVLPDAPAGAPVAPQAALRREVGPAIFSEAGQRGRKLFFDAVNTHLTPSGVVTCGTCHPGGGEDGRRWFLHTVDVPRKLRRTPPAWGARPGLGPLHWDGAFEDAAALTQATIRALMEGDGLLVDADAVAAYMAELPLPTPRPVQDSLRDAWARGEALFTEVGCAECHPAPLFADGLRHAVYVDSADPDGALAEVRTPSLVGARGRPPYLHDGRAESLSALLVEHDPEGRHGRAAGLSPADLDALIVYLESL